MLSYKDTGYIVETLQVYITNNPCVHNVTCRRVQNARPTALWPVVNVRLAQCLGTTVRLHRPSPSTYYVL